MLALLAQALYDHERETCVDAISNDQDKAQVMDTLNSFQAAVIVTAIFSALQNIFQSTMLSTGYFKQVRL